ncbi:MAG: 30S ribosomal protein S12 methylthiotransferase RimO [Parasporobacterium sp.]|nr:30S ribosomal protein S12 methylthiotransferase RimO [Parasporobacterium sp.]
MKINLISLGCDKNRVDSEKMLGLLGSSGFSYTDDESEADIIIINTCCFIDEAKSESIDTILEMSEYKEIGNCKYLFVTGCLAERYKEEVLLQLPEVDGFIGTGDLTAILDLIREHVNAEEEGIDEQSLSEVREFVSAHEMPERVITTPGHYEFLKIAEGCNKRCTYCIIPSIRGPYRSVPMEELLDEAQSLADRGVTELILVAQETTIYGRDLYGKNMLPELLHQLCRIEGFRWIRILYCYPEEITDELLEVIASEPKICHYLDIPIQHASDPILRRMGRRTSHDDLLQIIANVRKKVPDIVLRTSLITGFPGESEEDFHILKEFVQKIRFERLGVFTYSQEEGTPAAGFPDQIEEDLKAARREEIMAQQELISYETLAGYIGRTFDVVVDGYLSEEDVYVGRTYMDAPDVDGAFFFRCDRQLMSGEHVSCIVTNASNYDLYGELDQNRE